jgi:aspartyl protease
LSTTTNLRPTLARPPNTGFSARLVTLLLGSVLNSMAMSANTNTSSVAQHIATTSELLSGGRVAEDDFYATTGFHLVQNTIQLQTLFADTAVQSAFIVDSGAPMTLAAPLVSALGLKPMAKATLAGPEGGSSEVPVVRIPDISVAGLTFENVGAVVDWVQPPDTLACLSTAGLMGASLLQAAIWQIDFQSKQITISSSLEGLSGLKDASKIPFQRSDAAGSPRIAVGVSDAENVSLLIDLGFNGSIAIPTALLHAAGDRVPDSAPTEVGQASSTVFGSKASTVQITRLKELRLGTLRLENFPVVTGTAVSDFHVGIEFLRHFRVTLDWVNNDLYLELREPASALYDDFNTYGFAPKTHDGGLIVGALWREGAAAQAGLELGDRLVAIDNRDTTTPDFKSVCSLLDEIGLYGSNDATIAVTVLRNGVKKTVQVARTPLLPGQ